MHDPQPCRDRNCPGCARPCGCDQCERERAVTLPDEPELLAWVRGYMAGHDAGFYDGRAAGHDEHHSRCEPFYEQLVHQAGRVSTRAGRAKAWRDAVNRGLCP